MGSNEIRLRKQKLNPGRIARHRNYAELMRKHKRGLKTKQLLLVVIYIVIVLLLILLSFIAIRIEKNREKKSSSLSVNQKNVFDVKDLDLVYPNQGNLMAPLDYITTIKI